MTPTDLAAALLADVRKCHTPEGTYLHSTDVLAALSRALDPAIAERAGEVVEGVSDAPWRVGHLESYEMSGLAFRRVYFPTASEGEIHEAHIRGEDCDENARFIAWCREGVPALLAQNAALRAQIAFTATDGQRLLRKIDVIGVCDDPDFCFDSEGSVARCGPCAVKIAARDGVALNEYTRSNPQAMRLQRELSAAEAQIAALTARVEGLTGALEFYAEDGWKDRPLDPPTPEEVEMFGGNILDFPMPEVFFDRGERARAALSATTEEGHDPKA